MRFFDAHCDTVLKVRSGVANFRTGEGAAHLSYPGLVSAGSFAQVFACWILSEKCPGREREEAEAAIAAIRAMIESTEGGMRLALTGADLGAAEEGGPIAGLLSLEGADPLEGDPDALTHFHRLGVRSVMLAWKDNPFAGSAFGSDTPLSRSGERLVGLAEDLGVVVDVSHLSDQAFASLCAVARRPFIASHSNCRSLCPSLRNLTDSMIRTIAERGGVVGINLVPSFLAPEFFARAERLRREILGRGGAAAGEELDRAVASLPRPPLDLVGRHVLHALRIGGEDAVGLGGDLDGTAALPAGVSGIADYPRVAEMLARLGLSARQVEKVAFRNFLRVFQEGLPA